ncbi:PREDICTED: (Z)-3-hexen-1-ol acetyltransferase-like [Camelina sativa]|uniref:(Z)-3-hexen-1-ol acetyltransferase-like n=1 Tax=Camelina sativa TaxID=90675 RepID=A0ABM0XY75_CAMSA|nr:PREDICTED: (Z)-3-hexen-1-ol acetyltransferase-like [Camelina sativa]
MSGSLTFKVHRQKPELVSPANPTPRELKLLSDIDDQEGLRFHIPTIFFYRHNPKTYSDPVAVIRRALTETLVYYYPFAGRLREGPNRKLVVDCTGEGVLFIEADADVTLVEFEEKDALKPPFPCFEELLFDVEGSSEVLNTPLMLMQVTRLKCGGFIFAVRINHAMSDAFGLSLFLKTMCDFARGYHAPTVPPVWERHRLSATVPFRVSHAHREYDDMPVIATEHDSKGGNLVDRSFFFGHREMSAIRRLLPPNLVNRSTDMETLTSFLWCYRTVAIQPDPNKEMRLIFIVNARSKLKTPPLSPGYYGNAFAFPVAIATAGELTKKPLEFGLRLAKEAKSSVTEEYMRSLANLMVTKERPSFSLDGTYLVSDVRIFSDIDFGIWGKPVYGGIGKAGVTDFPGSSFYVSAENRNGETGIIVPVCLPEKAMQRFVKELEGVFSGQFVSNGGTKSPNKLMLSSL